MLVEILRQEWRLLTFRKARIDLASHKLGFLAFALIATWVAGLGRYWDHPDADWWQYGGLGSVAYVGVLSVLLWLVVLPLRPRRWSFLAVFVFVGLTAPPAWLYAIPVEKFMSMRAAATMNMWFLIVVAAWRVALYSVFLKRFAGLTGMALTSAIMLPLAAIVVVLGMLNLEHAVFQIMGGLDRDPTTADQAYAVIFGLSLISYLAAPVLLVVYAAACYRTQKNAN